MVVDKRALIGIPTIPAVAMRLLNAISDPNVPIPKIVEIIKTDPGITAKLLKAANSPFYGGGAKIDSLDRAVVWLGKHAVSCLALSFSLADNANRGGLLDKYYQEIWLQSVIQGLAMELLANRIDKRMRDSAFVTGLLMDVGRLALLQAYSSQYTPVIDRARDEQRRLKEIEQEVLETTHAEISGELLAAWSLPETMVEVVRLHDLSPCELFEMAQRPEYPLIGMANTASAASDFLFGNDPAGSLDRLQSLTTELYDFVDADLDNFLEELRGRLHETSEMFSTDISRLPTSSELLACAMEQLAQLSLRSHLQAQDMSQRSAELARENESLRSKVTDLEQKTCVDGLTEVYNREYFQARLQQRVRQCEEVRTVGVLFADIDKFKKINDTYGHLTGDEVLRHIGRTLRDNVRGNDVVARYGGEEFVILVDNPDMQQFNGMAERIRRCIAASKAVCGDLSLQVTISLGGVLFFPGSAQSTPQFHEELVAVADEAMYECKRAGGDRVQIKQLSRRAEDAEVTRELEPVG